MIVNRTLREMEDLMMDLVRLLLDIPAEDHKSVRIPYGASSLTGSAPAHKPDHSVCYVYVTPTDDGYGRQHHIQYTNGTAAGDGLTEVDEYTEEYAVIFSCYGPDSYDRVRSIRDGLFGIRANRLLCPKHIHFKPSTPPIAQTHELMNTQWAERCDLTATFYAYTRIERENAVRPIECVGITLNTENQSISIRE